MSIAYLEFVEWMDNGTSRQNINQTKTIMFFFGSVIILSSIISAFKEFSE